MLTPALLILLATTPCELWLDGGCLWPTPANNLTILAGIQPAELRRIGDSLSLARCAMEPGHLLHSTLTRPPSANARRLKSRHPVVPPHSRSSVYLTTAKHMRRTGRITDGMLCGWTTARDYVLSSPTSAPTLFNWPFQGQRKSSLTTSAPVSDVSTPACTHGIWPPLRLLSVAQ